MRGMLILLLFAGDLLMMMTEVSEAHRDRFNKVSFGEPRLDS